MGKCLFAALLLGAALSASAQKNDVGVTFGGYITFDNPLNIGAAFAVEGSYARRIASVPLLAVSAELPIAGSTKSSIPTLNGTVLARSYTSLFISPGLRVRLAPRFFLSPYVAAGVGYGRFNRQLFNGLTSSDGAFVVDIGGGLDIKILRFVSLRGEIRDFNSSSIGLQELIVRGRQNNLFFTLGLGARF
ncbi:MAG TPA: outer membrane beta-barrel protein [Candidatus Sulfotelmatobacter sp.]|nr:outer membrane beta-barrel protein [Candidatus Sulfotelmatobacter sp.]